MNQNHCDRKLTSILYVHAVYCISLYVIYNIARLIVIYVKPSQPSNN
jgi:hypothetical protein